MTAIHTTLFTPRYRELIRAFPLRQIRTKSEAQAATRILDELFPKDLADAGEEAYVRALAVLLADYEEKREQDIGPRAGVHALEYLMEEHGVEQAEIAKLLGISQPAVSMILRGERPITAEHARRLGKRFRVGGGVFL